MCDHHDHASERTGNHTLSATTESLLETGARAIQDFSLLNQHCAHLNAFHAYAADPSAGPVEASHFCSHARADLRQCVLYDRAGRLLGIEYMVPARVYATFPASERRLWHSHVFEVKSGQLVMPQNKLPETVWERAETEEMRELVHWYGKTFHLWRPEKNPEFPFGEPNLMMSFTQPTPALEKAVRERDERLGVSSERKRELRKDFDEPEIHPDADQYDKSKLP